MPNPNDLQQRWGDVEGKPINQKDAIVYPKISSGENFSKDREDIKSDTYENLELAPDDMIGKAYQFLEDGLKECLKKGYQEYMDGDQTIVFTVKPLGKLPSSSDNPLSNRYSQINLSVTDSYITDPRFQRDYQSMLQKEQNTIKNTSYIQITKLDKSGSVLSDMALVRNGNKYRLSSASEDGSWDNKTEHELDNRTTPVVLEKIARRMANLVTYNINKENKEREDSYRNLKNTLDKVHIDEEKSAEDGLDKFLINGV